MYRNPECQILIDQDASKKFKFGVMINYLKANLAVEEYLARKVIKLILFLSQLLNLTKI